MAWGSYLVCIALLPEIVCMKIFSVETRIEVALSYLQVCGHRKQHLKYYNKSPSPHWVLNFCKLTESVLKMSWRKALGSLGVFIYWPVMTGGQSYTTANGKGEQPQRVVFGGCYAMVIQSTKRVLTQDMNHSINQAWICAQYKVFSQLYWYKTDSQLVWALWALNCPISKNYIPSNSK